MTVHDVIVEALDCYDPNTDNDARAALVEAALFTKGYEIVPAAVLQRCAPIPS